MSGANSVTDEAQQAETLTNRITIMQNNIDHVSSMQGVLRSLVQNGGAPKMHKLLVKVRHHLPRGQRVS